MRETIWQLNLMCHIFVIVALALVPMQSAPGARPNVELDAVWAEEHESGEGPVVQRETEPTVAQFSQIPGGNAESSEQRFTSDAQTAEDISSNRQSRSFAIKVQLDLHGSQQPTLGFDDRFIEARVGDRIELTVWLSNHDPQAVQDIRVQVEAHPAIDPQLASDNHQVMPGTRAMVWKTAQLRADTGAAYQVFYECTEVARAAPVRISITQSNKKLVDVQSIVRISPADSK